MAERGRTNLIAARRAARNARENTKRRDTAIRAAVSEGWPLRVVAEAVELTHTAIARIVARGE